MLWLPLVAMVIASALPFPHNPVSGIAAAQTAQPGSRDSRKPRRDPAARLAAPGGNASRVDYGTAAAVSGQDRQDYVRSPFHKETSALTAESPAARRPQSSSGGDGRRGVGSDVPVTGRTVQDFSEDNSLPKQEYPGFEDVSKHPQDSAGALLNASTHGPEPLAPSGQLRDAARPGKGPSEESPALDAGLHLERDEMFLDAHPRVLFSPSLSPPEHPPLLLLLETGLPEEDGDADEQEDAHIEGHGDRAIDRSTTTQTWDRPVRREKRSHLVDSRRGERSVCESASNWVINKTSAVDLNGQNVTILQEIQTQRGPIKQYFYETRCGQSKDRGDGGRTRGGAAAAPARNTELGLAGAGCLGVDKKQWRSECKEKQSYVRALTRDANSRVGWRWIRIDTSCVCVLLSRTNQGREVLTRKGRG